ncbi:MAG: endonuclease/exonuclease/phosphatase family protein [Candidatus Lernaella stagnicola]|nr:endonuclease/exonuclease/phosphatase family protein [Candidatus Lernaella stagnicola]
MPFYNRLFWEIKNPVDRKRAAARLRALRALIRKNVAAKRLQDRLLIATWNLRDFDNNQYGHGYRLPESLFYIAEVISAFDIVAVQEINEDMKSFERLMKILGPDWDFIATDVTAGHGGNGERMTFVYDKRKVRFCNIAGEIVLPKTKRIRGDIQFARTPFLVAFQAGWLKYNLCTVHIYYGAKSGAKMKRRIDEIDAIAEFLADRAKAADENFVILGDFNIVDPTHKTMAALEHHGFFIPPELKKKPTNMFQTNHYDQISFKVKPEQLQFVGEKKSSGALPIYDAVFRNNDADFKAYFDFMTPELRDFDDKGKKRTAAGRRDYYWRKWRTWQMSDHLPMWIELQIDFSQDYLKHVEARSAEEIG